MNKLLWLAPSSIILLYFFVVGIFKDDITLWKVDVTFYGIWAKLFVLSAAIPLAVLGISLFLSPANELKIREKIITIGFLVIHLAFHIYGIVVGWMRMF